MSVKQFWIFLGTDNVHIWVTVVQNHLDFRPSFSHHSYTLPPYLYSGFSIAINCVQNVTTIVKCRVHICCVSL